MRQSPLKKKNTLQMRQLAQPKILFSQGHTGWSQTPELFTLKSFSITNVFGFLTMYLSFCKLQRIQSTTIGVRVLLFWAYDGRV